MAYSLIIGIDPGVKTGFAVVRPMIMKLLAANTYSIIEAFAQVRHLKSEGHQIEIWFEDSRQRKWFGKKDREALQGAGSIKRDCKIWQEFCEYYNIPFKAIPPQKGQTKWDAKYFKRITGWTSRTSEHARDAAALVFGA